MADADIVDRMADYLGRASAHLVAVRAWLNDFEQALEADDLGPVADQQNRHLAETQALDREYALLLREWDAIDVSDDRADALRVQARELEDVAREVQTLNDRAETLTRERMARVNEEQGNLRRGRAAANRYRTDVEPDRVDRQG